MYERKLFYHCSDFIIICKQRFRGKILLYWFNEQLSVQNPWLINQLMSPESVSLLLKFMWIKSYSMLSIFYHLKSSSKNTHTQTYIHIYIYTTYTHTHTDTHSITQKLIKRCCMKFGLLYLMALSSPFKGVSSIPHTSISLTKVRNWDNILHIWFLRDLRQLGGCFSLLRDL